MQGSLPQQSIPQPSQPSPGHNVTPFNLEDLPPLMAIQAELCERSMRYYAEKAWDIVEPGVQFLKNWHFDIICDHLEAVEKGHIRNLIVNIPPRCAKSLLFCVFFPTWVWIRRPETRWMFASYNSKLSIRDSLKCRNIIESPWYQKIWGNRYQLTGDQNVKERYENTKTGFRVATSFLGGMATGEGGDFLVSDDPHSIENALSDQVRTSQCEWYVNTWQNRYRDPKTVARLIIMQRGHEADLTGTLKDQGYEHLVIPMEYEGTKFFNTTLKMMDPRQTEGECMWPERFGAAEIATEKKHTFRWATQYQQRPVPMGGGLIKRYWWRYWQPADVSLPPVQVYKDDAVKIDIEPITLPETFDEIVQSWDLAFKDLKTSDYVAGVIVARKGANKYVLDTKHGQWNVLRTMQAIREFTEKWPNIHRKYVEGKANGPAVIQSLKNEITGLIEVEPEGGKIARAYGVSAEIESGNYYMPHPSLFPWVGDMLDELSMFPNGRRDDWVDAITQAGAKLMKQGRGPSITFF